MDVVSAVSAISALTAQSIQLVDAIATFIKLVKSAKDEVNTLLQVVKSASVDLKQFERNLALEQKLKLCLEQFYEDLDATINKCKETFGRLADTLERVVPGILSQQQSVQASTLQRKYEEFTWPIKRRDLIPIRTSLAEIRDDLSKKTGIITLTHILNSENTARKQAERASRKNKKHSTMLSEYWAKRREAFYLQEKLSKIEHANNAKNHVMTDEITSGSEIRPSSDVMSDSDAQKPEVAESRGPQDDSLPLGNPDMGSVNAKDDSERDIVSQLESAAPPTGSMAAYVEDEQSDGAANPRLPGDTQTAALATSQPNHEPKDNKAKQAQLEASRIGSPPHKKNTNGAIETANQDAAVQGGAESRPGLAQGSQPSTHGGKGPIPPPMPVSKGQSYGAKKTQFSDGHVGLPSKGGNTDKGSKDEATSIMPQSKFQNHGSGDVNPVENKDADSIDGPYFSFLLRNQDRSWHNYPLPLSQKELKGLVEDFLRKRKSIWNYCDRIHPSQLAMIQDRLDTPPAKDDKKTWVMVALQIKPKRARGEDVRTIQVILRWDKASWRTQADQVKANPPIPGIPPFARRPVDEYFKPRPPPPPSTHRPNHSTASTHIQPTTKTGTSDEDVSPERQRSSKAMKKSNPVRAMVSGGLDPNSGSKTRGNERQRLRQDSDVEADASTDTNESGHSTEGGGSGGYTGVTTERRNMIPEVPFGTVDRAPSKQILLPEGNISGAVNSSYGRSGWVRKSKRTSPTNNAGTSDTYITADLQGTNMQYPSMSQFGVPFMFNPNMMGFAAYQMMAYQQGYQQAYQQAPYSRSPYYPPPEQYPTPPPRRLEIMQDSTDYPSTRIMYEARSRSRPAESRPDQTYEMRRAMESGASTRMEKELNEKLIKESMEKKMEKEKEMRKKADMERAKKSMEAKREDEAKQRKKREMSERSVATGLPKVPQGMAEEMRKYTNVDFETDLDVSETDAGPSITHRRRGRKAEGSSASDQRGDISGNSTSDGSDVSRLR